MGDLHFILVHRDQAGIAKRRQHLVDGFGVLAGAQQFLPGHAPPCVLAALAQFGQAHEDVARDGLFIRRQLVELGVGRVAMAPLTPPAA